jgi:hypothetical protein
MAFVGPAATFLDAAAVFVQCVRRVIQHRQDRRLANRDASQVEVTAAMKNVSEEAESLKSQFERAELACLSAAVIAQK